MFYVFSRDQSTIHIDSLNPSFEFDIVMSSLLMQVSNLLLQLPYGVFKYPLTKSFTPLLDGLYGGNRGGCVSEGCFSTLSLIVYSLLLAPCIILLCCNQLSNPQYGQFARSATNVDVSILRSIILMVTGVFAYWKKKSF